MDKPRDALLNSSFLRKMSKRSERPGSHFRQATLASFSKVLRQAFVHQIQPHADPSLAQRLDVAPSRPREGELHI